MCAAPIGEADPVVLYVNGDGWGLHFGAWFAPDAFHLDGFETPKQARAFAIASGCDDPAPHDKPGLNAWGSDVPVPESEPKPVQGRLL